MADIKQEPNSLADSVELKVAAAPADTLQQGDPTGVAIIKNASEAQSADFTAASNTIAESTDSSDDPSNLVRQARKVRPSSALICIAEFVDVGVISLFGALIVSISVASIGALLPGVNHDLPVIAGCAIGSGLMAAALFMFSAIIPIFFPIALTILQIAGGASFGTIVFSGLCAYMGADPTTFPLFAQLAGAWLTLTLSLLPILACPLYFAWTLSSRWQTSVGWSIVGLMVCNQDGLKPTFEQAFKRTILRLWWPIMFPGKVINTGFIDDWVEEHSQTALILKPQNLKAELIKAKDHVQKSKDKIQIVAHHAMTPRSYRALFGKRGVDAALSAPALKKMLKPDWPSVILRAESYFALMLLLLFLPRSLAAYWTNIYFSGFHVVSRSADAFSTYLAQHPDVAHYAPMALLIPYLAIFFVASRAAPQIFLMTPKGFQIRSKSTLRINKMHQWKDVTAIHMEEGVGKGRDEKWLVFAMSNEEPVRVRLDIIHSISSKEEILRATERWAPQAARTPELVRYLEPPSDYSYTDIWLDALTAPPKRDKLKPLIAGAVLRDNQYRITRTIAVGGQGSVYLANDCLASIDVVLKEFVLPVYVDLSVRRKTIERFEKEARLLKRLDNDQVVKLLDFFVEDHRAYLVLEHLEGKNLRQVIQESGRMESRIVVSLALQMCEILTYLHGQSPPVVHRDFTPDNMILGNDGRLRLIDFNVAQVLDNAATTTGTVVGKPSYLAPEQFRGEPTPQSDIYSMGATLAYLLTAQDPLPISQSHPCDFVPTVAADLDYVVSTCTNCDLGLRYQSAEEVEDAVRAVDTPGTPPASLT